MKKAGEREEFRMRGKKVMGRKGKDQEARSGDLHTPLLGRKEERGNKKKRKRRDKRRKKRESR